MLGLQQARATEEYEEVKDLPPVEAAGIFAAEQPPRGALRNSAE